MSSVAGGSQFYGGEGEGDGQVQVGARANGVERVPMDT